MRWLIIDGYNMVGAWDNLRQLAQEDLGAAREVLCDTLIDYCGYVGRTLVLVFDAHHTEHSENITMLTRDGEHQVVYTKRGQTADQYIERFVRTHRGTDMCVASSDALIQIMIFAHATRISARELLLDIQKKRVERYQEQKKKAVVDKGLEAFLDDSTLEKLERLRNGKNTDLKH